MRSGAPPARRLRNALFGRVLLAGVTLAVIFSLFQARLEYRREIAELERSLSHIESGHGRLLAQSLLAQEPDHIAAQLASIRSLPFIVRAAVVEKSVATHETGRSPTGRAVRREFPLTGERGGIRAPLGTLQVEADVDLALNQVIRHFLRTLIFQLATVGITGCVLLAIFHRLVTRHLVRAALYFETFAADGTAAPLRLERAVRRDEIDNLVGSFNELRERFAATLHILRESEEKYHDLYREAAIGIFHSTLDGKFIDVNPALARMLGYESPAEVLGAVTSIAEQVYADPLTYDAVARQVLETGGTLTRENRYRRRDGSLWWGLLHLRLVRDKAGRPIHREGFVEDITARKRMEAALRESQRRYAVLFDANPVAVALTRFADSRLLDVNGAWQELTGYARAEVVGHPATAFNLWVDSSQRTRALQMLQELGRTEVETKIRTKRGEVREVLMSGEIVDLEGERFLLSTAVDITERKSLELQARYQASLLARVFDAIVATDRQFRIRYWNAAAERLYGWSAAEVMGCKITEYLRPVYAEEPRRNVMHKIARQGTWSGELVHNRRDGTTFPVQIAISEVRDAQGRIVGHVAINRDITALKESEARLKALNRELARSNADLERFAYSISHDLQEPVRMVASFAGLLASRCAGLLDQDGREFLRFVQQGAGRLRLMIDDLLRYSRVTTRGGEFASVPLEETLKDALRNLALALQESGGTVVHEALPTVLGDRSQLTQLFQNLIGNALKFRKPDEPPRVEIGARLEDPASAIWTVSVRDNGIGIDPKFFDKIFVVFQRLHADDVYPGTGIGLALCQRVVERHGGRIRVESTPGAGSTFLFTLPAEG